MLRLGWGFDNYQNKYHGKAVTETLVHVHAIFDLVTNITLSGISYIPVVTHLILTKGLSMVLDFKSLSWPGGQK